MRCDILDGINVIEWYLSYHKRDGTYDENKSEDERGNRLADTILINLHWSNKISFSCKD